MSGSGNGELILYRTEDGRASIQLRAVDGTVWLTQAEIAALFDTTPQNVTLHLRNLYAEDELDEAATCKELLQVQAEGARSFQPTFSRPPSDLHSPLPRFPPFADSGHQRIFDALMWPIFDRIKDDEVESVTPTKLHERAFLTLSAGKIIPGRAKIPA